MICCLTPTLKIPLREAVDKITERLIDVDEGFEAFDFVSGKVERIKMPLACVLADSEAKSEILPLKGYRANLFCARDMADKSKNGELSICSSFSIISKFI